MSSSAPPVQGADSPRKVRILFTERFYYPDGHGAAELPVDVTTHLAEAGFAVEVICGSEPEGFGLAEFAVVTLRPEFAGLVVASKLQGYMARGIPVLYIGPNSDVEQFIGDAVSGVCLRVNDVRGVGRNAGRLGHRSGIEQVYTWFRANAGALRR